MTIAKLSYANLSSPNGGEGLAMRMSRRNALMGVCAATVVAVVPMTAVKVREPLVAMEARLGELRAMGETAFEACQATEDHAAEMRAELAWEAIMDRVGVMEREMWNTPARSIKGGLIKLRETHHQLIQINESEGTLESEFAAGLVGDVLNDFERLTTEARA